MEKQNANSRQLGFIVRRDGYLTEAMGEFWYDNLNKHYHGPRGDWATPSIIYNKCNIHYPKNNGFSIPEGFFKLWIWAKKQKWWEEFIGCLWEPVMDNGVPTHYRKFDLDFIDPDKFADALYRFVDA